MAHMLVGLQELVQVLHRNPLTSDYRCFTIKQAGKSSTNIMPRKSLEKELCFTRQNELKRAGCSPAMPTLNMRRPSLAPSHSWTPALLNSRDNWLQTALFICLLCLTVEVTSPTFRSNHWFFTCSWHSPMVKRLHVHAVYFWVKSSGGLC